MTMTLGMTLGSYELYELVGRGAMGEVHKGARIGSTDQVAVKILRPELVADPELVARFLQERTLLCSVSHPNLVCVHDLVIEGGTAAIVMDLVEGSDMRQQLNEQGPAPAGDAAHAVASLLSALSAVHAVGIIHRDIKPENVLVDVDGRIRVTDFGIARLTHGPSLTRLTGLIGTPEYLAPEVAERELATPAADVYAAGIVLYELLTGYTPFTGGHPVAVLRRHMEDVPARPEGVPDQLWDLIAAMLEKDPSRRPTAAAAASRLVDMLPTLDGIDALPPMKPGHDGSGSVTAHTVRPGDAMERSTVIKGRGLAVTGTSQRWTSKRIAVLALSVLVVITAVAVMARTLSKPAPTESAVTSYAFPPESFPSGLMADRTWSIAGNPGDRLLGKVTLTNGATTPMTTSYDEVIPNAVAKRVQAVSFTPRPNQIVQADPVVRYTVDLPPGASSTVEYQTQIPPFTGSDLAELKLLAHDQAAAQSAYLRASRQATPSSLTSLSIMPTSLSLHAGQSEAVVVSGVMGNGLPAPEAALKGLSWTSDNPSVAQVSEGTVVGLAPGASTITAQAGSLSSQVAVDVVSAGPASSTGGPSTGSSPSQSPSAGSAGSTGSPSATRPGSGGETTAPSSAPSPGTTGAPSPTKTTVSPTKTTKPASTAPPKSSTTAPPKSSTTAPPKSSTPAPSTETPATPPTYSIPPTTAAVDGVGCPLTECVRSPDINGDGVVNCTDLGILQNEFGQSGPNLSADIDGDGTVTAHDLSILITHWTEGQPTSC